MNRLPSEIISLILDHLSKQHDLYACTLVNHQLYIAANPLLWRSPTLRDDTTATHQFLMSIVNATNQPHHHSIRHHHVRKLELVDWIGTDDQLLFLMTHIGPFLEELDIRNTTQITDASMQLLPHHCPNLQSLHLKKSPPTITHHALQAFAQHSPLLRQLSLVDCRGLGCDTFSAAFALTTLSVGVPFSGLRTKKAALDLTRLTGLTRLTLSAAPMYFIERLLSTLAWSDLVALTIIGYKENGSALIPFLKTHPGLKRLQLERGCFSDKTLDAIATVEPPGMVCVNVSGNGTISERGVRRLVQHCPRLESLSMDGCGIKANAFPEAGEGALKKKMYADYLDQRAINRIRTSTQC